MQFPSAMGATLNVLLVFSLPFMIHAYESPRMKRICLLAIVSLSSLWAIAQYIAQSVWLCSQLSPSQSQLKYMHYVGIEACHFPISDYMNLVLWKYLLLGSISLGFESLLWKRQLPEELQREAPHRRPCVLFWPQHPEQATTWGGDYPRYLDQTRTNMRTFMSKIWVLAKGYLYRVLTYLDLKKEIDAPENDPEPLLRSPEQHSNQISMLYFAVQQSLERLFETWGSEIILFFTLLSAFSLSNVVSLGLLVVMIFGMKISVNSQGKLWKFVGYPYISAVLIWQYSIKVRAEIHALDEVDDTMRWFGLLGIKSSSMWMLYFLLCLLAQKMAEKGPSMPVDVSVWCPMSFDAKGDWKWHDWMRYITFRWYLDFVLVSVIALCSIDNDIIHAGYLGIALLYFRSRIRLRHERNKLFKWLPIYNMAVIVTVILFQAPFEDFWNIHLDDTSSCTLAHLLGLYKINSGGKCGRDNTFISWKYEGALADIILWLLIRLQTHIYDSGLYIDVVYIVESEEEVQRQKYKAQQAQWIQSQALAALQASENRSERSRRIKQIKSGVDRTMDRFVAGANPTSLDYQFLEGTLESEFITPEFQDNRTALHVSSRNKLSQNKKKQENITDLGLQSNEPEEVQRTEQAWVSKQLKILWGAFLARTDSRESLVAYGLFMLAYVSDFSILTMVFPASAFCYSLVSVKPRIEYWQFILIYCEAIIMMSYGYQIPALLNCSFISDSSAKMYDQRYREILPALLIQ